MAERVAQIVRFDRAFSRKVRDRLAFCLSWLKYSGIDAIRHQVRCNARMSMPDIGIDKPRLMPILTHILPKVSCLCPGLYRGVPGLHSPPPMHSPGPALALGVTLALGRGVTLARKTRQRASVCLCEGAVPIALGVWGAAIGTCLLGTGAQESKSTYPPNHTHSTVYLSIERPLQCLKARLGSAGRFPVRGCRSISSRRGGLGSIPAAPWLAAPDPDRE